ISAYTCPECNGPLWEIQDGDLVRYRCRVGHAFTQDSMLEGLTTNVEDALWTALNTLEESIHILSRMAEDARARHLDHAAKDLSARAAEKQQHAHVLRRVLLEAPRS